MINNQDNDQLPESRSLKSLWCNKLKNTKWLKVFLMVVVVLAIIAIILWKPWITNNNGHTISVTGSATIKTVPDEYVFTPSYSFTNSNQQAALQALSTDSNQIVSKLKSLGVPSSGIATSSTANNGSYTSTSTTTSGYSDDLSLTVTVDNKTLAQTVQDYITTTNPTGSVSPQAQFSQTLTKQLENEARIQAEINAKDNAEQSAKNLGFSLGGVKSVNDSGFQGSGTGCYSEICPIEATSGISSATSKVNIPVQPGENQLNYTVTVVYYIH